MLSGNSENRSSLSFSGWQGQFQWEDNVPLRVPACLVKMYDGCSEERILVHKQSDKNRDEEGSSSSHSAYLYT